MGEENLCCWQDAVKSRASVFSLSLLPPQSLSFCCLISMSKQTNKKPSLSFFFFFRKRVSCTQSLIFHLPNAHTHTREVETGVQDSLLKQCAKCLLCQNFLLLFFLEDPSLTLTLKEVFFPRFSCSLSYPTFLSSPSPHTD